VKKDRRKFLKEAASLPCAFVLLSVAGPLESLGEDGEAEGPVYAMGVQIDRCIGCGLCARACKTENNVLDVPYFFRTWIERYEITAQGEARVESPNGGVNGFPTKEEEQPDVLRSFFVPKLCNHCNNPPCVQVCPVGATFKTEDGVVLVDPEYCIGCRYCIQACPYGARYLDPRTKTADKCTFCYHRIKQDMLPACVEVCPTEARVFGDLNARNSPLQRLKRNNSLQVLKPSLNTEPKVVYTNLDREVS